MAQSAATPPGSAEADDIVVYAARLSKFRASVAFGHDGAQCRIHASTGDAGIDQVGCRAIERCYPAYQTSTASGRERGQRRAARKALDDCFATTTRAGLTDLADRRAAGTGK